uniref:Uncharacterized protein n=1 Tax=Ananas comosus var. bracteatus TaxID=296719 RepID=A0A6V7NEU8_ANACO|nr:unnamed protein product [Ananas comosus var. bracteatus]
MLLPSLFIWRSAATAAVAAVGSVGSHPAVAATSRHLRPSPSAPGRPPTPPEMSPSRCRVRPLCPSRGLLGSPIATAALPLPPTAGQGSRPLPLDPTKPCWLVATTTFEDWRRWMSDGGVSARFFGEIVSRMRFYIVMSFRLHGRLRNHHVA